MRRTVPAVVLWSLVVTAAWAAPPVAAQEPDPDPVDPAAADLPEGFTDGEPVGGTELPPPDAPLAPAEDGGSEGGVAPRSSHTRYFGQEPWNAIRAAAAATPRPAGCALSDDGLAALVVAPVFKESSAATTPSSAPSPMTLSRYDEWSGVMNTNSNVNANYGLYEGRNPHTPYFRAYWHPGIGIWQYDSAGVGAPFTAIERMDVPTVAADVAAGMASRYCNPPASIIGHGPPFTDQERRNAAWWPWWTGNQNRECPLCQREFGFMTASRPYFSNISLVSGISNTGGAVQRSCTLSGQGGPVPCWYVNPSVGVIQGATAWATLAPHGNNSPTVQPAPLSHPFYVIERDGFEERHWLRADTGYPVDVSARRQLGRNARPRSNQAGSGLAWARTSGLCDVTTGRGPCTPTGPIPAPAAGINATTSQVGGLYRTTTLDVTGDGRDDILWYAPGPAADSIWIGEGSGRFRSVPVRIDGTYEDVEALDVDGDGRDDLLFYSRTSGIANLWRSNGDGTFTASSHLVGAGRQPLIGDFDRVGRDQVFWYGPGTLGDAMWTWTGSGFSSEAYVVNGHYQPFVGDFDGNGLDDIFWYAPGPGAEVVWLFRLAGGKTDLYPQVNGHYQPLVGDFDGDGFDDIFWYAPGPVVESVWFGAPAGRFGNQGPIEVTATYTPVVADLQGDGRDDILWYGRGAGNDLWTRWGADRGRTSVGLSLPGGFVPIAGRFSAGGGDGIFWYAPGATPETVWWR